MWNLSIFPEHRRYTVTLHRTRSAVVCEPDRGSAPDPRPRLRGPRKCSRVVVIPSEPEPVVWDKPSRLPDQLPDDSRVEDGTRPDASGRSLSVDGSPRPARTGFTPKRSLEPSIAHPVQNHLRMAQTPALGPVTVVTLWPTS